ncbi:MAG: hypothetical protein PWP23_1235 [Candidatus Sumerlaeota bacterium]|nr:hypothetical protein [Candidatus Sumerlaeota bacterium]
MQECSPQKNNQSRRSHLRLSVLLGLALCILGGYFAFTTTLATSPVATTQRYEKEIRSNRIVHALTPPRWRKTPPRHIDYYLHFAVSVPYGLLAGFLGFLGIRLLGRRWKWVALGIPLLAVLLIPAYDEYRQQFIPKRNATWEDLQWAWGGIIAGWGAFLIAWGAARRVASIIGRRRGLAAGRPEKSTMISADGAAEDPA